MDESLRQRLDATGVRVSDDVAAPASVDEVAAVLRACAGAGARVRVQCEAVSGGGVGGVVMSLHRIAAVDVDTANLMVRAGAGATVRDLVSQTGAERLRIVGMPDATTARHAGSLIARGELPRRALCGIEAVLPNGETVRFGGVLKDVVGYDLPALLLGSLGRLAVIVSATFRLEPRDAPTPVAPAPGVAQPDPRIVAAFDPDGLLQPV